MIRRVCYVDNEAAHDCPLDPDERDCGCCDIPKKFENTHLLYKAWELGIDKRKQNKPIDLTIVHMRLNHGCYKGTKIEYSPDANWFEKCSYCGESHYWIVRDKKDHTLIGGEKDKKGDYRCDGCQRIFTPGQIEKRSVAYLPYNGYNGIVDVDAKTYKKLKNREKPNEVLRVMIPSHGQAVVKKLTAIPTDREVVYRLEVEGLG